MFPQNPSSSTAARLTPDSPLLISISGTATITKQAERAVLQAQVSSSGLDKKTASRNVTSAARTIRTMLETSSTTSDPSLPAPIAGWNVTSIHSVRRHQLLPSGQPNEKIPPVHQLDLTFTITVQHFPALGPLASHLSSMPHVTITSLTWTLTDATKHAHEAELRRLASANALAQAKDYAAPLGMTRLRPITVEPSGAPRITGADMGAYGATNPYANAQYLSDSMASTTAAAGGLFGSSRSAQAVAEKTVLDLRDVDGDLAFFPEDVHMTASVGVKFLAETEWA